ncbi:hypothetical protein [Brevundimonas sp. TSRC1-1]|uniref:hypothetical protein n=1 Tax=Brevundimonas sp. TSRC1-1 TaxID=2804562 RepID=UPI0027FDF83E|nr:hypothetical protein [Pseudomonas umsongensis]
MTYLRRYTDVLSLLDMLKHNRLTLLSPDTWFDRNDSYGLREYGKRRGAGEVYALCMTAGPETGHHWQLFAGSSHGVCVHFDLDEFRLHLDSLERDILHGPMRYLNLTQVRDLSPIPDDDLPFLKRVTFEAESEYRVVAWEEDLFAGVTYALPMPARLIKKVTLGPLMPRSLAMTLKDIACEFVGCEEINFTHSRVHNNESWRAAIDGGHI